MRLKRWYAVNEKAQEREILINVKDLCCIHGNRYTLANINWQVERGSNWLVFGLNGSGKTTLLSIIAGFTEGSSGQVKVFGQEYDKDNTLRLRQKIGWVSSSFFDRYYSNETALNIVLSGLFGTLGVSGVVEAWQMKKALNLLRELNLYKKENRIFKTMSKGERQNVLIARALIATPEILVLDEPGNGLDVLAREYMLSTIQKLVDTKQMTVLYVTHYVEEILPIFDNALLLKDGRVYLMGKTQDILTTKRLSDYFSHDIEILPKDGRYSAKLKAETHITELI